MDHAGRLARLRKQLEPNRLDFLLITQPANIRYLCGFTGSSSALLVGERGALLFTDGRYTVQAKQEVESAKIVISPRPALLAAAAWLGSRGKASGLAGRAIGVEGEVLSLAARRRFAAQLPAGFRIRIAPPLVETLRMVKDAQEIQCLRAAVVLGSRLFNHALKTIRPGIKEVEVAAELEYAAKIAGAGGMSFETIIASGMRSAMPHGRASSERLPGRGFVVCDFGVILAGYCSDMTRTLYLGRASREARAFYQAVRDAQAAAVEAIRPGVAVGEVDLAARKLLKKQGLAKYFSHSTGHGVGLEIHEGPRIASGLTQVLQPGMVITIEPGAYIPGKWGVRIEDMVVVTNQGREVLTPTSKELLAIQS